MPTRRNFIRNTMMGSAAAIAKPAAAFAILHKDKLPDDPVIGHGAFTYKADKNWAKISVNSNPLLTAMKWCRTAKAG